MKVKKLAKYFGWSNVKIWNSLPGDKAEVLFEGMCRDIPYWLLELTLLTEGDFVDDIADLRIEKNQYGVDAPYLIVSVDDEEIPKKF